MTAVAPAPSTVTPTPVIRDRAVDVARAICLLLVVLLHAMMVGVSVQGGAPVLENAMARWDGFPAATWIMQMMPLFFVLGGFSSYTQWNRMRDRGATAGEYFASRVRRLMPAAAAASGAIALILAALSIAGVPDHVVAEAGFRISQPLWFLGVYLLCTVFVPLLAALHRRHRFVVLGMLATASLAVDILRGGTGVEALGYLNLVFVWLTMQQLGFLLADGTLHRLPRTAHIALTISGVSVLAVLCLSGAYGWNLFDALNPPTFALILLGVSQTGLVLVARARLSAWYRVPAVGRLVDVLGRDAMTVYAWHMGVLVLFGGLLVCIPGLAPVPLTGDWWASRPLWLAAIGVLVVLVVRATARFDRPDGLPVTTSIWRGLSAAVVVAAGVVLILVMTGSTNAWLIGAFLQFAGMRLALAGTPSARRLGQHSRSRFRP